MLKHAHSLDCALAFFLPGRPDVSPCVPLREVNHRELHVVRMWSDIMCLSYLPLSTE